jgi:hypothetical protein
MSNAEYSEQDSDREGRKSFRRILAAGFIVVVVVVAAVLFFVNRGNDDKDGALSGGSGSSTPAEQFDWAGKKADPRGVMVYFPKDTKGQPLSDSTRDYSGNQTAAASGTPSDTVFETTDFSGGAPIPFSTKDGPTGFDGTVPTGYSKSAAGAALALAAYLPQVSPVRTTYEEFTQKATVDATSDSLARAADRVRDPEDSRAPRPQGEIEGGAFPLYSVQAFDGDYARIILYNGNDPDRLVAISGDLRWEDNTWKGVGMNLVKDVSEVPQGAQSWVR